jgi:uncharacterized protein with von Willebrand factor type A (vWA) domain
VRATQFPATASGVSERVAGFMAHLRDNGMQLGVAETTKTLQSFTHIDITDAQQVRLACKAICSSHYDNFKQFDELFDSYWFNHGRERQDITHTTGRSKQNNQSRFQPGVDTNRTTGDDGDTEQPDTDTADGEANAGGEGKLIASRTTNLEKTDFRELMTPEALQQAEVVAARLARAIRDKRSRRHRAARRGAKLDHRKTIRQSISHGGVPIELFRQNKPDRPVKIVALLDVSGSMTVYARVFLSFLKGLISHDTQTDAYLFHTSLVRISDALRDHDTFRAVNRLSLMAQGFGGGTKIATNLQRFNEQYATRTVNGRSVVIILSDGYDTDAPELMSTALRRLKKRNCRIIWLNPLKGWKDYAPVAQGMAAALPHIDHFAPANKLQSLAALEPHLKRL